MYYSERKTQFAFRLICLCFSEGKCGFKNTESWTLPWVKVRSACTSRSPCRWRSPGGKAGSPSLRWRPCSRCRSRWGRPGSPWSCSCSSGTPAGWAFSCTVAGEGVSLFLYWTHHKFYDYGHKLSNGLVLHHHTPSIPPIYINHILHWDSEKLIFAVEAGLPLIQVLCDRKPSSH